MLVCFDISARSPTLNIDDDETALHQALKGRAEWRGPLLAWVAAPAQLSALRPALTALGYDIQVFDQVPA
jgi:hypothetical protein